MKNNTILLILSGLIFTHQAIGQWTVLPSGTNEDLFAIDFADAQNGVAVGNNSTILITTDGGNSWVPSNTGEVKDDFHSVHMISADTIFAASGTRYDSRLYRTVDGGQHWESIFEVPEVAFTEPGLIGFDYQTAYYSTDHGDTWDTTDLHIGNTVLMENFQFADATTGYLSGNISGFSTYSTYFFRTDDGGQTWASLWPFDLPNNNALTSLAAPHPDTAYLFNNQFVNFLPGPVNQLVRLTDFYFDAADNIRSWRFTATTVNMDMPGQMISSYFPDGSRGFAGSYEGDIYHTENGGQNWTLSYDGDTSIFEIAAVEDELLYAVGGNGLLLKYALNTGTKERPTAESLQMYPNPARQQLFIRDFPVPSAILSVYAMDGSLIGAFEWTEDSPVDISDLPRGAYLLELRSGNTWHRGRFIKQ